MDFHCASPDRYKLLKEYAKENRRGGLVIEVDGGYHAERQQAEDDAVREKNLEQMGFHVMRFTNEEVLYDIDNVITQIENYFNE